MRAINRINIIKYLTLSIVVFLSIPATYSKEPSKKQRQLWEQINEAAKEGDEMSTISLCRSLICKSQLNDSLALRCRYFLANYYLQQDDYDRAINGLWEQYVFFKKYSEAYPFDKMAEEKKKSLKKRYEELIEIDKSKSYWEGIYFSDLQKNFLPFLTLDIRIGSDNRPTFQILPCCEIANISKAYNKLSGKSKNRFGEKTYLTQDTTKQTFLAFWGDEQYRNAQTEIAKSFVDEAANLKIKTAQIIASTPQASLSDQLLANLTAGFVSLGLEAIANSLSQIKIQAQGMTLIFDDSSTEELNVHLIYDAEVYKTGEYEIKKVHFEHDFKMYKVRPHYNIYFANRKNYSVLCSYGIINDKNSNEFMNSNLLDKQYHPISIENADIKENKTKSIHKMLKIHPLTANRFPSTEYRANYFSYLNFYKNYIFNQIDSIDFLKPLPKIVDMSINIADNNTITIYYNDKGEKEPYVRFSATKDANGDIGYFRLNEFGEKDGTFIIYKPNGEIIKNNNVNGSTQVQSE